MRIVGIDPGTHESAYVIWDGSRVEVAAIVPNDTLLNLVPGFVINEIIAIEKIASYGMAVGAEVFETCVWTGRFMQAWHQIRREGLVRIPRLDIKLHLCHSPRAKDANVRQALIDRLGEVGTKKNPGPLFGVSSHCWAALAVCITAYDRYQALN